jgi:cell division septal protein FtsQ
LTAWLAATGYAFWAQSDHFRIQEVAAAPGAPEGLVQALGVEPGDHLFGFSTRKAAARLKKDFPELRKVNVRRGWNRHVWVSFEKRVPEARLLEGEKWWGMDREGTVFPLATTGGSEKLTILAGAPAGSQALPVMSFVKNLKASEIPWTQRLYKVKIISGREAHLFLEEGARVYWGPLTPDPRTLAVKARRLQQVLQDQALAQGVEYVRFVDDARLAAKPKKSTGQ